MACGHGDVLGWHRRGGTKHCTIRNCHGNALPARPATGPAPSCTLAGPTGTPPPLRASPQSSSELAAPPGAAPPGSARPPRGRPERGRCGEQGPRSSAPLRSHGPGLARRPAAAPGRACWQRCWHTGLRTRAVSSLSPPLSLPGLHVLAIAFALEVSVGKTNTVMALNNSNVLLPCVFTTCIGFQDLDFTWYFNLTEMIYHGKIKSKASEPILVERNPRVEFVGSTTGKDNNISIVLKNVEFSDAGRYTCHVKNPKEKKAQHNATIILTVVQKMVEADNTVTLIIVGIVGGAHRPPHPLHARQEGCPVHHQEDPGWEEGVSGELLGERQHRERLGRLQGGTKSTTKGM
ncbi:unnamed protein product, partial [Bubo scandiacus]